MYKVTVVEITNFRTWDTYYPKRSFGSFVADGRQYVSLDLDWNMVTEVERIECETVEELISEIAKVLGITLDDIKITEKFIVATTEILIARYAWFMKLQEVHPVDMTAIDTRK